MNEVQRIDWARRMMWERATVQEQGEWLRMADEEEASIREALARPWQTPSPSEGEP